LEVKYRTILKTKLLLHNRQLYLAYGMALCLVTFTDLQTRRAGLLASTELHVYVSAVLATATCLAGWVAVTLRYKNS